VRVCSTHLTNTDDKCPRDSGPSCRWQQAQQIKEKTNGYLDNGVAVVVGGDFNARPSWDTLDHLYAQSLFGGNATGHFKEVDQFHEDPNNARRGGEITWESRTTDDRAKFDYIFVNAGAWDFPGGYATSSPYSDHHPLLGHATLNTP
jgi:endonuclease/exonuclease/phosphatase family metal-dependent hydrolase